MVPIALQACFVAHARHVLELEGSGCHFALGVLGQVFDNEAPCIMACQQIESRCRGLAADAQMVYMMAIVVIPWSYIEPVLFRQELAATMICGHGPEDQLMAP